MNIVTIVAALLASVIPGPQQQYRECITVDTDHNVVIRQSDWQIQEWHYIDRGPRFGEQVDWDTRPPKMVRKIADYHFAESRRSIRFGNGPVLITVRCAK